jgi:hypothetical protein
MSSSHDGSSPAATPDPQTPERRAFKLRARHLYELRGRPWHGNVIWVGSPLTVEITQILASFLSYCPERRVPSPQMRDMLREWLGHGLASPLAETIAGEVSAALDAALRDVNTRTGPLYPRLKSATAEIQDAQIIAGAAGSALDRCSSVESAGRSFWETAMITILPAGVFSPVRTAPETIAANHWSFAHRDFILVAEQPVVVHREAQVPRLTREATPRLHCVDGPAISWPDGWCFYALRGMEVPVWLIEQPERITVAAIEREQNAEWRRLLIERYGWARYLSDSGAEVIDTVPMDYPVHGLRGARLLRKQLPGEREPLVYLEMINSTPEPDGSQRRYLTRVNPRAY